MRSAASSTVAATAAAGAAIAGTPAHPYVRGAALGTRRGKAWLGFCDPTLLTREAAQLLRADPVLATADKDGLASDQRLGHLAAATLENASDGLARDTHDRSGLLVAQALEINEADRLELVDGELQLLQLPGRHAGRLEERDARDSGHRTLNRRARHGILS
jgi:hypothetical protein